jgi:hypothetical protein
VNTGKCLGVADGAAGIPSGTYQAELEPCGINGNTLQIVSATYGEGPGEVTAPDGGQFVISLATQNYSDPEVLTTTGTDQEGSLVTWQRAYDDDGVGDDIQSWGTLFNS